MTLLHTKWVLRTVLTSYLGVYDIHSPRVPSEQEIKDRVAEMLQYLKPDQLWVNPDCGLKTRGWKETKEALSNMVAAAQAYRQQHSKSA